MDFYIILMDKFKIKSSPLLSQVYIAKGVTVIGPTCQITAILYCIGSLLTIKTFELYVTCDQV